MSDISKRLEERRIAREQEIKRAAAKEFLAENQVIEDAYYTPKRDVEKQYEPMSSDGRKQGIKNVIQRVDNFTAVPADAIKRKSAEQVSPRTESVDTTAYDNSLTGQRKNAQKELGSVYSGIEKENKTPLGIKIPETIDTLLSKSFDSGVQSPKDTVRELLLDGISPQTKAMLDSVKPTSDYEFSGLMDDALGDKEEVATVDDIMSKMKSEPDGTYTLGGRTVAHNKEYARMLAENYYNEREHWRRFMTDRAYRADYIYKTTGMNEEQFIAKKVDKYSKQLDEIEESMAVLRDATYQDNLDKGLYDDEADSAAAMTYGSLSRSIRDLRTKLRSFKKNDFWSGLAEGFSLSDLLMLGIPGLTDSLDTLEVLNKANKGEQLNAREELVLKVAQLAQEVDEDRSMFRNDDTFSSNNVGNIVGIMPGFGVQMAFTGGITPFGKKLAQESLKQAFKSSVKKGLALGLKKAGAVIGNRAVQVPFMAMTYQNYIDNRRAQYRFENHILKFSPSNTFSDIWKAYASQFSEIHSEDVGDWISEGLGYAGRAIAHTKFANRLTGGLSAAIADKLSRYSLPPVLAKMRKDMRISGFVGENLSEAYGDLVNSMLTMDSEGVKQLATSKYWWELMASTAIMTGSFYSLSLPDLYSYNKTYNNLRKMTDVALHDIASESLRDELKVVMSNSDLDKALKALSKINWNGASVQDIVNAIKYTDGVIRLDMLRSENVEELRLKEFMPYVEYLSGNVYQNTDGTPNTGQEKIVSAKTKDGNEVWIVSGDYAGGSGTLVVRDSNGKPKMINAQDVLSTQEIGLSDLLSIKYAELFKTSIARENLENLIDAIRNAADEMPADKVAELIRNNGFRIYKAGDNVKLSNGEDGVIDTNINGYEYLVRTQDGKLRLIRFYSILQPDIDMAQAQVDLENEQQQIPTTQPEQSDGNAEQQTRDYAVGEDVQTADGKVWNITRQIEPGKYVLVDDAGNYATVTSNDITPYTGDVASPSSSEEIPTDKSGNIDYSKIKDPQIIAKQLSTSMGSAGNALSALSTVIANIEARIAKLQSDNTSDSLSEIVERKKEMDRLIEERDIYAQAHEILSTEAALAGVPDIVDDTPADARKRGYRRVNGQKVDRQSPIKSVQGKEVGIKFSDDIIVNGHVAIIDVAQLQPSHIDGRRNPLHFIDEAQPKERNDKASMASAQKIAENIRPEEVTSSVTAYTGAPTVNTRGEVIQGNNRSYALRLMWESHKEQAEKYKAYLKEHAGEFGLEAEDIDRMQSPVLVNMIDVDTPQAISLGQYEASDTESGGVERIKPKNVLQKMGEGISTFANLLLRSNDEDTSFAGLLDENGVDVLKWLARKGYITPTQYNSAFDSRGNLTAEAKNDLRNVMYQHIFQGASAHLEAMFNTMPVKAQRAILATAFRDYESSESERMLPEIQNSIRAYYALSRDTAFASATSYEDVRRAVDAWAQQYQMDDVTGEGFLPADNFSNFALLLATIYKAETQSSIQNKFNKMYDLIQGVQKGELFETAESVRKHTLAEAIKQVLNIDYNGQIRSDLLDGNDSGSQRGQRGGAGDIAHGESVESRERATDSSKGTGGDGGRNRSKGENRGGKKEKNATEVNKSSMSADEAVDFIADMELNAEVAPQIDLTIENWDSLFGESGIIATPIGEVKIGENQFTKLMRKGRNGKLGMIKPTLENPHVIVEEASEAKEGDTTERASSYIFIRSFKKADGSRYYYFTSITVSKEGKEVVVSNQEKSRNKILRLLQEGNVIWRTPKDATTPSAERQGLDYEQTIKAETATKDSGITPQSTPSENKGNDVSSEKQEIAEKVEETVAENAQYTIEPAQYTTKKGKVLDMHLVKFGTTLTKEQYRTAKELAKADKGWYDREKGGFMMRSEETAKQLANATLGNENTANDAEPVSMTDIQALNDGSVSFTEPQREKHTKDDKEHHPIWQYSISVDADGYTTLTRDDISSGYPVSDGHFRHIADSPEEMLDILRNPSNGMQTVLEAVGTTIEEKIKERKVKEERKRSYEALRANGYNGYKIGDEVMYKGNKVRIYDLEEFGEHRPVLDVGLAPVLYEVANWDDISKVEASDTTLTDNNKQTDDKTLVSSAIGKTFARIGETESGKPYKETLTLTEYKDGKVGAEINTVGYGGHKEMSIAEAAEALRNERWQETTSTGAKNEGQFGLVSDERMEELKKRLRKKLGGQLNIGIDPEVLTIGLEIAVGHLDRGIKTFADFAKVMISDLGDAIRPYLKAFYNGARDLPEVVENGLSVDMTPYAEVQAFDVANFDKTIADTSAATATAAKEAQVAKEVEVAQGRIKKTRNTHKQSEKKAVSLQGQNKPNNNEQVQLRPRAGETGRREGHESRPNETLGASAEVKSERIDESGVDRRNLAHSGDDTVRGRGVSQSSNQHVERKNSHNNHSERGVDYAPTSVDARIEANLKAIELAKSLLESGERATPEQMAILRRFSGWGGLGKAFDERANYSNGGSHYYNEPTAENKKLRALLGEDAYQQAVMSANSAYYTPAAVINTLWDIAEQLGFKGGTILEGSAGIGNILGQIPEHISDHSDIRAVEIDSTAGGILSLLYPDAQVEVQGFEQSRIPNCSVDLAITNVPFVTGLRVNDTSGDGDLSKKFQNIHDFCIAKNVRKLRAGGIGIFITSSGTLDNSQSLRNWVVNEGESDFIGAFRMNNKTFGGTSVTSDIVVVRKRINGAKSANAIDVSTISAERTAKYDTNNLRTVNGKAKFIVQDLAMDYNRYFVEHPERMGGEMFFGFEKGDTYRPTSKGLYQVADKNQDAMLQEFVQSFHAEETARQQSVESQPIFELSSGKRVGEMYAQDGKLLIADSTIGARPVEVNANKVKGHTKVECFDAYSAIKSALSAVLDYQKKFDNNDGLQPLLEQLNKSYDNFVQTYGHFNKNTAIAFLRNDIDYPNVQALETFRYASDKNGNRKPVFGKSDIFSRRVVQKYREPEPTNVKDGISASIFKFGRVDVSYIAEQLGKSVDEVKRDIIAEGYGFEDPTTRQIEVSYKYTSGNVREKLRQAQNNNIDGIYDANIKALEKVMPMNIPAHLIEFTLGSSFIDPKIYGEYTKERTDIDVEFSAIGGTWVVKAPNWVNREKNRAFGVRSASLGKIVYGNELITAAIQNKTITVSKTERLPGGKSATTVDAEATQACAMRIDEIRQDFKDWLRQKMQSDTALSENIEREYNEQMNNYVPMTIPEEFAPLHYPGMVTNMGGKEFALRQHQTKAVQKGITQPTLLAHEVGTGKTYTLITTAMEMRRLGTARKPMIVVQNATVGQFVEEAKRLYPNAKILTLEEADRTLEGRSNFYAKIRYNDWDMIVIPQSTFEFIPDSMDRQITFIQSKIDEKERILEQMQSVDNTNRAIGQAKKDIDQLREQLSELSQEGEKKRDARSAKRRAIALQNAEVKAMEMLGRTVDDVEDFDEMGIDALLIDEAHEYKHLGFATAMQRGVKGIDPSYSKKSQSVYLKTQAVLENNNGRNVVFATGTPISNTAAEVWTFMRYLMPADTMKEYGIYYFDDFVRNFGNIQQMLEFTTSGKFKENNRFAGYTNLPELARIWSSIADIALTEDQPGIKERIPELENHKEQDIYLPQTRALRSIMKYVNEQLRAYEQMSGKEKKENSHIPLTMYGIAQSAAVDPRLVLAEAEDEPHSKTNEAVRQTLRSLKDTESYKGTVAIFADHYQNRDSGFNLYDDIRSKLIAQGVPAEQVVIIKPGMTVKKKLEIFDKVNSGDIRVILGSTYTLGTGVNIQERLHTLIHLDAPNRPMDYTQRNGRILRQGNMHKEWNIPVRILRMGVEDSLDVTAYQRLKTKGAIANSIMHSNDLITDSMNNRSLEEDNDVFGDVVAQLSGSEYAQLKNQAEKELRKYESRQAQWKSDQIYIYHQKPKLQGLISAAQERFANARESLKAVQTAFPNGKFSDIVVGKQHFADVAAMADFIKEHNKSIIDERKKMKEEGGMGSQKRELTLSIGDYTFNIQTVLSKEFGKNGAQLFTEVHSSMTYSCPELGLEDIPVQQSLLRNAIDDIVENVITGKDFIEIADGAERSIERNTSELNQLLSREGQPFAFADELAQAKERVAEYTDKMKVEMAEKERKYAEMDASVNTADIKDLDTEEDDDIMYRIEEDDTNRIFNNRLEELTINPNQKHRQLSLGIASEFLRAGGLAGAEILLDYDKLVRKSSRSYKNNHPFVAEDIYNLPIAINNPIAIFANMNGNNSGSIILTELQKEGRNFIVAVHTVKHTRKGRTVLEVNEIISLYPKEVRGIIHWFNQGRATNINKKKALRFIEALRPHVGTTITNEELSDATKVVETFENSKSDVSKIQKTASITEIDGSQLSIENQMRGKIDNLSKRFNVGVEIITDTKGLSGKKTRAKGYFDKKTGKVVIVLPNNSSVADVEATYMHEVVGHYGLRKLLGVEQFNTMLDNIWDRLDERRQATLQKRFRTNNGRVAVEEMLATMAEGSITPSLIDRILGTLRSFFRDVVGLNLQMSDKDMIYMLYRSAHNLQQSTHYIESAHIEKECTEVKKRLDDIYSDDTLFREKYFDNDTGRYEYVNEQTSVKNRITSIPSHVLDWAQSAAHTARRLLQDRMLPVKDFQKQLTDRGVNITNATDYYTYSNTVLSRVEAKITKADKALLQPLISVAGDICRQTEMSYDALNTYILAESAYERDLSGVDALDKGDTVWSRKNVYRILRETHQLIQDSRSDYIRKNGIAAISDSEKAYISDNTLSKLKQSGFDSLTHGEQVEVCSSILKVLWERINAMNRASLAEFVRGGLKSQEEVDRILGHRWQYYVPQIGKAGDLHVDTFDEFSLDGHKHTGIKLHEAEGRNTKPENPLNRMWQLHQRVINAAEDNIAKQQLLQIAVENRDKVSDIVEAKFDYMVSVGIANKGGKKIWEFATEMPAEEDIKRMQSINKDIATTKRNIRLVSRQMKQLEDKYGDDAKSNVAYGKLRQTYYDLVQRLTALDEMQELRIARRDEIPADGQTEQNVVEVYSNGVRHILVFADAQVARCVRGEFNTKVVEYLDKAFNKSRLGDVTRGVAQMYTTFAPDFIMRNIIRDVLHASIMQAMDKDCGQFARFSKNIFMHPARVFGTIYRGVRGKTQPLTLAECGALNILNRPDRMALVARYGKHRVLDTLYEYFTDNGGRTGFVHIQSLDKIERQLIKDVNKARYAEQQNKAYARTIKPCVEFFKALSTVSEDASRFATFLSDIDAGKSLLDATAHAKDITTNFNRRGELSGALGSLYIFFNATIQGTANILKVANRNRNRALTFAISYMALGFMNRYFGYMWQNNDDDDLMAEQIPLHVFEDNLVIPFFRKSGNGRFLKIPQPQGLRTFFQWGAQLADVVVGKTPAHDLAGDMVGTLASETLVGYQDNREVVRMVFPTILQTLVFDPVMNKDAFGRPIHKEDKWGKGIPNSELGNSNVNPLMYYMCKGMNAAAGGSTARAAGVRDDGTINKFLNVFDVNPSNAEYVVKTFAGGSPFGGKFSQQLFRMAQPLWDSEAELEVRNIPLINTIISSTYTPKPNSEYYEGRSTIDRAVNVMEAEIAAGMRKADDPMYIINKQKQQVFREFNKEISKIAKARNMFEYGSPKFNELNEKMEVQMRICNKVLSSDAFGSDNVREQLNEIVNKYEIKYGN